VQFIYRAESNLVCGKFDCYFTFISKDIGVGYGTVSLLSCIIQSDPMSSLPWHKTSRFIDIDYYWNE